MTQDVIRFSNQRLAWLDQRFLPNKETWVETADYRRVVEAIKTLAIRGAPLIGIAGAYAASLGVYAYKGRKKEFPRYFNRMMDEIGSARPTAVNLRYACRLIREAYRETDEGLTTIELAQVLSQVGTHLHQHEIDNCKAMAEAGCDYLQRHPILSSVGKLTVLTHCNTGILATGGIGTALGVIKEGYQRGLIGSVISTETRPLGQGLRLTAWELLKEGIPFHSITDSSAAFLMQKGDIHLCITGADRIAKNGDTANKIGTFSLAVSCHYVKLPFFIAAPLSTFDAEIEHGQDIPIEERDGDEVRRVSYKRVAHEKTPVINYAFDVTPSALIEAFFTEDGVIKPADLSEYLSHRKTVAVGSSE